jgi:choline dehydrogenase
VKPLIDSPNVGLHLQDHPMAFFNWHSRESVTLDDASSPRYLLQWLVTRRGKLSSTVTEAVIHWRSDSGLPAPDFQIYFAPVYFWEHGFRKTGAPAMTIAASLQAPESRGQVRLRSASPQDHPRILNNFLSQDSEVDAMLRAFELIEELAGKQPLGGLLGERLNPGDTVRTRTERIDWLRATAEHTYHPSCTCRIGSQEDGVVDPELRVHGVEGLRVADTSVMPRITSGNTNAPTYMIAERCAALVMGEASAPAAAPTAATA